MKNIPAVRKPGVVPFGIKSTRRKRLGQKQSGEATSIRGGKRKRYYTTINAGKSGSNKSKGNSTIKLSLQPMSEIALGDDLNNSIGQVMVSRNVWMIGLLSVIVILSACFNYTNLSIARSLRRSREVGIRKVVDVLRSKNQAHAINPKQNKRLYL